MATALDKTEILRVHWCLKSGMEISGMFMQSMQKSTGMRPAGGSHAKVDRECGRAKGCDAPWEGWEGSVTPGPEGD